MLETVLKGIERLGHAGFSIEIEGVVIVIDPFQITDCPPADIVLVTHSHYDHCSPEDIAKILKPDTVIVTEAESAEKLSGDVRVVKPGDRLRVGPVEIEATPAYNIDKRFHQSTSRWLGFIITVSDINIYHAGDTDLIPEMDSFEVDIALLPVSGVYVMTAKEAAEAAKRIKPSVAIPMHYGRIVGSDEDAETFKRELDGICEVRILP